jgi:aminopeptidase N
MEKADSLDVYITHPSELKAASNGKLMSVTDLGNGNSRTHWKHAYPVPVYLIAIAVTNYEEYNNSVNISGTEVPIVNYVYPESLDDAQGTLDATPNYIAQISAKYGDYPYKLEKYGHAEWEWGGGMEHATMSFVGGWSGGLIRHELAHQWFGDKVTCHTWNNIWLNEGFAEYTDGWLIQLLYGDDDFRQWKEDYVWYITDQSGGSVYIPDSQADDEDRIFDYRLTYGKGSMMVHLIRYIINDDDLFYQALRDYLNNPNFAYGYATTDDLHASLEASTGMDWDNFFEDWIYGQGHPVFTINVNSDPNNMNVTVKVNQVQSNPSVDFFETPFEIEFHGTGGQTATRRFNLTQNGQEFLVTDLPFEVTSYTFNPNFDVVCRVNITTLNNEEMDGTISTKAKIYPNPATAFFTVDNQEKIDEIKVFDVSGKIVFIQNNVNQKTVQVNSNSWPVGTYMVQIKSGNRTQLMKVLVK